MTDHLDFKDQDAVKQEQNILHFRKAQYHADQAEAAQVEVSKHLTEARYHLSKMNI